MFKLNDQQLMKVENEAFIRKCIIYVIGLNEEGDKKWMQTREYRIKSLLNDADHRAKFH